MSALRGLLLCLLLLLPSAARPSKEGRDSLLEPSLLGEPGLEAEGRKVGNGSSQETPRSRRAAAARLFSKPEPGAECPQGVAEEEGPGWSRSSLQPWPLGGLEGPVCRVKMEQDGATPRQLEVVGVLSHYESTFIKLLRRRRSWDGNFPGTFGLCRPGEAGAAPHPLQRIHEHVLEPGLERFLVLHLEEVQWEAQVKLRFQLVFQAEVGRAVGELQAAVMLFYLGRREGRGSGQPQELLASGPGLPRDQPTPGRHRGAADPRCPGPSQRLVPSSRWQRPVPGNPDPLHPAAPELLQRAAPPAQCPPLAGLRDDGDPPSPAAQPVGGGGAGAAGAVGGALGAAAAPGQRGRAGAAPGGLAAGGHRAAAADGQTAGGHPGAQGHPGFPSQRGAFPAPPDLLLLPSRAGAGRGGRAGPGLSEAAHAAAAEGAAVGAGALAGAQEGAAAEPQRPAAGALPAAGAHHRPARPPLRHHAHHVRGQQLRGALPAAALRAHPQLFLAHGAAAGHAGPGLAAAQGSLLRARALLGPAHHQPVLGRAGDPQVPQHGGRGVRLPVRLPPASPLAPPRPLSRFALPARDPVLLPRRELPCVLRPWFGSSLWFWVRPCLSLALLRAPLGMSPCRC
ncbi:muellerian-inhibiting factor isoform X3 [Motacilla alba alba]|uniref:muellerian-inhibiting factor isoform X3 n=1 Tax=Motacilla alba alba TaxID=1094192 RepID=UPI0018D55382|nr:muellerian-inhibiting factor isoform X3 [Motacilla alba alba]